VKFGVSTSITQEESGRVSLTLPNLGANRKALRGAARLKVSWAMLVCGMVAIRVRISFKLPWARRTLSTMTERSVHRVPLDIWFRIAPALSRKDLMALCMISSHFLPLIRPLFYRVVKLRSDAKESRATVNLLARDRSLASFVVELVLIQHTLLLPGTRRGPLISLESLGNMTSLRRVTLCGIVFNSQTEQHDFGALLQLKTSTTLEQVTYRSLAYAEWWPADSLGLGGLEIIEWDARGKGMISFALSYP
jgi:hypothetical protein